MHNLAGCRHTWLLGRLLSGEQGSQVQLSGVSDDSSCRKANSTSPLPGTTLFICPFRGLSAALLKEISTPASSLQVPLQNQILNSPNLRFVPTDHMKVWMNLYRESVKIWHWGGRSLCGILLYSWQSSVSSSQVRFWDIACRVSCQPLDLNFNNTQNNVIKTLLEHTTNI